MWLWQSLALGHKAHKLDEPAKRLFTADGDDPGRYKYTSKLGLPFFFRKPT